jgi:hypothetical protein
MKFLSIATEGKPTTNTYFTNFIGTMKPHKHIFVILYVPKLLNLLENMEYECELK